MCLKPGKLFDFPVSVECSNSKGSFVRGWLKKFSWLADSVFLDGAFCLPCVLFGVQSGRNSNKLDKLYKTPLTLLTSDDLTFYQTCQRILSGTIGISN